MDPSAITISPWIREQIRDGQACLFLGAGASYGAQHPQGARIPSGDTLKEEIADQFLGGHEKSEQLHVIAAYARDEAGHKFNEWLADRFREYQPASFHQLLPSFRWKSIFTTNFDLIVERAYEKHHFPLQTLRPVYKSGDPGFDPDQQHNNLILYKLHGCVSKVSDTDIPPIIASEEYANFRHHRETLFTHLKEQALSHPLIFCGYRIQDPNIQQILFDLKSQEIKRPRFVLVDPGISERAKTYWEGHRFYVVKATFEQFLNTIDKEIDQGERQLRSAAPTRQHLLQKWAVTKSQPSTELAAYVPLELSIVFKGMPTSPVRPRDFYHAINSDWGVFEANLDLRRKITDDLILEGILKTDLEPRVTGLLLKGHAGSGKSITLKRVAWEAAQEHNQVIFFLTPGGRIRPDLIVELYDYIRQQLIIVIDDVLPHKDAVIRLTQILRHKKIPACLMLGTRSNEWNMFGTEMDSIISTEWELRDPSRDELGQLLQKLEANGCLESYEKLTPEVRLDNFVAAAKRQLLVALHEITTDKSFEDIVVREYQNVQPAEARELYMDVCTLHRLSVPVRAGLISRVSGINLEYFKQHFLGPLERIVKVVDDVAYGDYIYLSRHPKIAEFVFDHVNDTPQKKADRIARVVACLNPDFKSDADALDKLIRAQSLVDVFLDRDKGNSIYQAALSIGAEEFYVLHQQANFELLHGSRLDVAKELAEKAWRLAPSYRRNSIDHTRARILRELAKRTDSPIERERLRTTAKDLLRGQLRSAKASFPYYTLTQILIDEINDRIKTLGSDEQITSSSPVTERVLTTLLGEAEQVVTDALKRFPNDSYAMDARALLSDTIGRRDIAKRTLQKALDVNPGNPAITRKLATILEQDRDVDGAQALLEKCLQSNPGNKDIHFSLARLLQRRSETDYAQDILHHLRGSFAPGDPNLDAQFAYARHQFLFGNRSDGLKEFSRLASVEMTPADRHRSKGIFLDKAGQPVRIRGTIENLFDSFAFIKCPPLDATVFVHYSCFLLDDDWDRISHGTNVEFTLAFNFKGPVALAVRIV